MIDNAMTEYKVKRARGKIGDDRKTKKVIIRITQKQWEQVKAEAVRRSSSITDLFRSAYFGDKNE